MKSKTVSLLAGTVRAVALALGEGRVEVAVGPADDREELNPTIVTGIEMV